MEPAQPGQGEREVPQRRQRGRVVGTEEATLAVDQTAEDDECLLQIAPSEQEPAQVGGGPLGPFLVAEVAETGDGPLVLEEALAGLTQLHLDAGTALEGGQCGRVVGTELGHVTPECVVDQGSGLVGPVECQQGPREGVLGAQRLAVHGPEMLAALVQHPSAEAEGGLVVADRSRRLAAASMVFTVFHESGPCACSDLSSHESVMASDRSVPPGRRSIRRST